MHPIQLRTASGGLMKGRQKKAGFIGPLLGALAGPLLGAVVPGIIGKLFGRKNQDQGQGKKRKKAGLAAPYGGIKNGKKMCSKSGMMRTKKLGRGAFQPGPLA